MGLSVGYMAGFFDGEGSIGVYPGGQRGLSLRVQITQNKSREASEVLEQLKDQFGGSVHPLRRGQRGRRDADIWSIGSAPANGFLEFVLDDLILKKSQAQLAVAWQSTRPDRARTPQGRVQSWSPHDQLLDERVGLALRHMKKFEFTDLPEFSRSRQYASRVSDLVLAQVDGIPPPPTNPHEVNEGV